MNYSISLRVGKINQLGVFSPALLLGIVGILLVAYIVVTNVFRFQDSKFSEIFPKPSSHAAFAIPNDPFYSQQWGLSKIGAYNAWEVTTGSDSVVVAVVDTGVDTTHPDLSGRLLPGKNIIDGSSDVKDTNGRGTHIAGIIVGVANNNVGVVGLDWKAKVLPVKVADSTGGGTFANIAAGIRYAVDQGAKIIVTGVQGGGRDVMLDAIKYSLSKGVVVIAPAGDYASGTNHQCPACYAESISVAFLNQEDLLGRDGTVVSNYGAKIDIAAPGLSIVSTVPSGTCKFCDNSGYKSLSGTAVAAAYVAGATSLVMAHNPAMDSIQAIEKLRSTTDPVNSLHKTLFPNAGRLNIAKALGTTISSPQPTVSSAPSPSPSVVGIPSPNPTLPSPSPVVVNPTGLSATCNASGTQISFNWNESAGATRYYVRVNNRADGWSGTCTSSGGDKCDTITTNSYTFTSIPGARYSWWVHSGYSFGNSPAVYGPEVVCPNPN